jgi:hypothetical protein
MGSDIRVSGRTKMLSLSGCCMDSVKVFAQGATVRIKLLHQGSEVMALARVVYSNLDLGIGVAFTSVETEGERILESWIAEFQGIPIREPSIGT